MIQCRTCRVILPPTKRIGHKLVFGWLESEVLTILEVLNSVQKDNGTNGSAAEIGVHHGKLFIGLHLLKRPTELSVAIDVFGDQELNVDASGGGDIAKFRANVRRWSSTDGLVVHQGDSTELEPRGAARSSRRPDTSVQRRWRPY